MFKKHAQARSAKAVPACSYHTYTYTDLNSKKRFDYVQI